MDDSSSGTRRRNRRYRGYIEDLSLKDEDSNHALLPNLAAIFDHEQVETSVQHANESIVAESFANFRQLPGLEAVIVENLRRAGIERPTVTQQFMIPHIAATENDVVVHATSRTGKTFGFTLPIVMKISEWRRDGRVSGLTTNAPFAFVFVPTKTLGYQLYREITMLVTGSSVSCAPALGGVAMRETGTQIKRGCDIVIGTPGRVFHLLSENRLTLANLRFMIYDEADDLFATYGEKHEPDVVKIVNEMQKYLSTVPNRAPIRSIFCSATWDADKLKVRKRVFQPQPHVEITIGRPNTPPTYVKHNFVFVQRSSDKNAVFAQLLPTFQSMGQTIVFINKDLQAITNSIIQKLPPASVVVYELRSDNYAEENLRAIDGARENVADFMIASRIGARGLNFPACRCVVNFDVPRDRSEFLNRLSRCALAGANARTFSFFALDFDWPMARWLCEIVEQTGQPVPSTLRRAANRCDRKLNK